MQAQYRYDTFERIHSESQARHQTIKEIEIEAIGICEMFREVHDLVQEQGRAVEEMAEHVKDTNDHVRTAETEIEQASKYQGKSKRCCLILLVLVCGVLLGVILYLILS